MVQNSHKIKEYSDYKRIYLNKTDKLKRKRKREREREREREKKRVYDNSLLSHMADRRQ